MSRCITITIARTAGSVPREAGTSMRVWADRTDGTIGGGALEWQAMAKARNMLTEGQNTASETIPLGPALGQCCGGSVTLEFAVDAQSALSNATPLWIWGAGHVGRAIAAVMAPLPGHAVTLIDTDPARMPNPPLQDVTTLVAADMPRLVPHAPAHADHLILTYSHQIDLSVCHALLSHRFASCGLIGSATKWARFRNRLQALGHTNSQVSRIACPIGDPALGKHPQAIAVGVAAALINAAGQSAHQGETAV